MYSAESCVMMHGDEITCLYNELVDTEKVSGSVSQYLGACSSKCSNSVTSSSACTCTQPTVT
jgi:hypothetical protein